MLVAVILAVQTATSVRQSASANRPESRVEIRVTDRSGTRPLTSAHVKVTGRRQYEGDTGNAGRLVFRDMKPGTYLLHVERDGFIAFEKEFTVRTGGPIVVPAMLSRMTARPISSPASAPVAAGPSRVLSIPEFVEGQLIGKEAVKESPIACSGLADARLIQVHEPLATHTHSDADEMLYVVAGEGSLTIAGVDRRIAPGWFSIIPRGAAHAVARRGRSNIVLLSTLSGPPCAQAVATAATR